MERQKPVSMLRGYDFIQHAPITSSQGCYCDKPLMILFNNRRMSNCGTARAQRRATP